MKHILCLIAVSILARACCPCRSLTSTTADSVRIETVIRTEFVKDTVYIDVPRERESQVVADSSHLETEYARSDARILTDGRLFHLLENKAQKKPVEVKRVVEYRDSVVYRDKVQREVVEVERAFTVWQRLQMTGFWVFVTAILALVAWKLRR